MFLYFTVRKGRTMPGSHSRPTFACLGGAGVQGDTYSVALKFNCRVLDFDFCFKTAKEVCFLGVLSTQSGTHQNRETFFRWGSYGCPIFFIALSIVCSRLDRGVVLSPLRLSPLC